ncbi:hypothetical protein C8J57DRAFT_73888 [Mycena rebaudengoi]|nr:hypothetical protein C8J57DRAFT_73888 [Mycena rebaudengoi]
MAEIPLDVVLELTCFLDLQDSVHLLATCTSYRSLLSSRDFWLKSLERMEKFHRKPIPSAAANISALPLEDLRTIVAHTYKLMKNWASDHPAPVSVRRFDLGTISPDYELCPIPGTHLIVTSSWHYTRQRLACWDTVSGKCLSSFDVLGVRFGGVRMGKTPFQLPGQCFIALVNQKGYVDEFELELAVILVDYRNCADVTVSKIHSKVSPGKFDFSDPSRISLDEHNMCAIGVTDVGLVLLDYKHQDDSLHRGQIPCRFEYLPPACLLHNGTVYVTRLRLEAGGKFYAHVDAWDSQSYGTVAHLPFSLPEDSTFGIRPGQMCSPKNGVFHGTTLTQIEPDAFYVLFWPAVDSGSARLEFTPLCVYEHSSRILTECIGLSGVCVLLVERDREDGPFDRERNPKRQKIGLVRYVPHPSPHAVYHRLEDCLVEINNSSRMVFDDALGVIYIANTSDSEGVESTTLSVISYA